MSADSWLLALDSCVITACLVALYFVRACQMLYEVRKYKVIHKAGEFSGEMTSVIPGETVHTVGNINRKDETPSDNALVSPSSKPMLLETSLSETML